MTIITPAGGKKATVICFQCKRQLSLTNRRNEITLTVSILTVLRISLSYFLRLLPLVTKRPNVFCIKKISLRDHWHTILFTAQKNFVRTVHMQQLNFIRNWLIRLLLYYTFARVFHGVSQPNFSSCETQ